MLADGTGGAFLAWQGGGEARMQRLDASGAPVWAAGGISLGSYFADSLMGVSGPFLASDGTGGVFAAWRSGNLGVSVLRFDAGGNPLWTSPTVLNQGVPHAIQMAADRTGGVLLALEEHVPLADCHVHLQRIDSSGAMLYGPFSFGTEIAAEVVGSCGEIALLAPSGGTAVVAWSSFQAIRVQHLDAQGSPTWGSGGVELCGIFEGIGSPALARGFGNTVTVTWKAGKTAEPTDILAQKLRIADGTPLWGQNGVVISSADGHQSAPAIAYTRGNGTFNPHVLELIGLFTCVIAWNDERDGKADVYAQGISVTGVHPPIMQPVEFATCK